jgi:ribonuclease HII
VRATGRLEASIRHLGYARVAGVDEAGRGSLFGSVFAAAVVLDPDNPVRGLADSKVLLPETRVELAASIRSRAVAWAVGTASAMEIDRINILQASRLAMRRAVQALSPTCDYLLLDAITIDWPVPQRAIIKGDAKVEAIAAASILAKVERDAWVERLAIDFPGYGLARHKGYPTSEHRDALRRLGPTPLHRRSYEPVREALQGRL